VTGRRTVATVLLALVTTGCVGPSRTSGDYRDKAGSTAAAAESAAQTALLAVHAQTKGNAPGTYLSVILGEAEEHVGTAQNQFDSVQPPNTQADQLRGALDNLLSQASDVLSALRIAARRGQLDQLAKIAQPLEKLSKKLDQIQQESP